MITTEELVKAVVNKKYKIGNCDSGVITGYLQDGNGKDRVFSDLLYTIILADQMNKQPHAANREYLVIEIDRYEG